jgi:hypothetical protein
MKNPNRTRDLPASTAVPQPAAPPRTPKTKQFKRTYEKCTTCLIASGELKDFACIMCSLQRRLTDVE